MVLPSRAQLEETIALRLAELAALVPMASRVDSIYEFTEEEMAEARAAARRIRELGHTTACVLGGATGEGSGKGFLKARAPRRRKRGHFYQETAGHPRQGGVPPGG
jgi:hypothetical protein